MDSAPPPIPGAPMTYLLDLLLKYGVCACTMLYVHKATSSLLRLLAEESFWKLSSVSSQLHVHIEDTGRLEAFDVFPILRAANNHFVSHCCNICPKTVSFPYMSLHTYCNAMVILSPLNGKFLKLLILRVDDSTSHYEAVRVGPMLCSVLQSPKLQPKDRVSLIALFIWLRSRSRTFQSYARHARCGVSQPIWVTTTNQWKGYIRKSYLGMVSGKLISCNLSSSISIVCYSCYR
jgi:hypothetical protein